MGARRSETGHAHFTGPVILQRIKVYIAAFFGVLGIENVAEGPLGRAQTTL